MDETLTKPYIELGRYRHYEGNTYQVFGVVKDVDTKEWKVSYGEFGPEYTRSYEKFVSQIEVEGELIPRYQLIARVEIVKGE